MDTIKEKGQVLIDKLSNSLKPKFQGHGHKLGVSATVPSSNAERLSKNARELNKSQHDISSKGRSSNLSSIVKTERNFSSSLTPTENVEDEAGNLEDAVEIFFSGNPSTLTVDVLKKLLLNIINNPTVDKFRRIRLSNPKIMETIGSTIGGIEILLAAGFVLQSEGRASETFAVIADVFPGHLEALKKAIELIGLYSASSATASKKDRARRVFLPAEETAARRIEIPDSFYELSASEARFLAASVKKSMEQSRELTTKAWKERQNSSNKRKCKVAIIRIQMPDMMILEGQFFPAEPTSSLYEFVAANLEDPSAEFDLIYPIPSRNHVLPSARSLKSPVPTLEDSDLIPAALVRLRPAASSLGRVRIRDDLCKDAERLAL